MQESEFLNKTQETNRKHLAQVEYIMPVNAVFFIKKKVNKLKKKKVNKQEVMKP